MIFSLPHHPNCIAVCEVVLLTYKLNFLEQLMIHNGIKQKS